MLTGDNQNVAEAIGREVGIDQVIAGVLPTEKAAEIKKLQDEGNKVAFVGDGINDAPALSTADVGIAMGSGTDIAIESGGIVLVQNDLMGVVRALEISKKTFNRIKLNLFWALIYNTIGIPIAAGLFMAFGVQLSPELAGLAMAFSSVSVVTSSLLLNKTKLLVKQLKFQSKIILRPDILIRFSFCKFFNLRLKVSAVIPKYDAKSFFLTLIPHFYSPVFELSLANRPLSVPEHPLNCAE